MLHNILEKRLSFPYRTTAINLPYVWICGYLIINFVYGSTASEF